MKSGFVSIIGRSNVGKSTLLNTIVKDHIAITSDKSQTTRNLIQGIYNDENTQIVFVDTPGIHKPVSKLGNRLNSQAYYSIDDVDAILFVVDASVPFGAGDKFIIDKLKKECELPVILVLNKIDKISDEDLYKKILEYKDLYDFSDVVPVSGMKNDNVERLISVVKNYLTDNQRYYVDNEKTTSSIEFRICETVREKVMQLTSEEVPHSVACVLLSYEETKNIANISIDIIVDRDNLKKIIIGKNGAMLKEIGSRARLDIENFLGKQVYLELYVRTMKKWRSKDKYLKELGYDMFHE